MTSISVTIGHPEVSVSIGAPSVNVSTGTPIARDYVERDPYTGDYTVTPTEEAQTLATNGLRMTDDVSVSAIASDYVGSGVPRKTELSVDGLTVTADAGYYADAVSETISAPLQEKTRNIGAAGTYEETADDGYYGLSKVTTKVPSGSLSANAEAGYTTIEEQRKWRFRPVTNVGTAGWFQRGNHYGAYATYDAIPTGTTVTPSTSQQTVGGANTMMEGAVTVDAMPNATWKGGSRYEPVLSVSVDENGLVTGSVNTTSSVQPLSASGYAEKTHNYGITIVAEGTQQLSTVNGATVTPTESEQTAVAKNKYTLGAVKVGAIPSNYVGSGIPVDPAPTASGKTVTIPTGYYSAQTTKDVADGSAGTPSASKGAVSNHSVTVTPSVTNSTGYITGGTKTGTGVSVSASELVSGTKQISANGTNIDVTEYAKVDVAVPSSSPALQTKSKTYTPTTSQQTEDVTADSGYDGLEKVSVTVNAMPSGTAGTPTATKGAILNHQVTVTPSVTNTTGYITGSTKTGTGVTVSANELSYGSETKTANGTYDVTNLAELVVNVSGTSKNFQCSNSQARVSTTAYSDTGVTLTVAVAGTYDIYWSMFRSSTSSGTQGTQLYKGTSTQGSAFTSWSNHAQVCKLTGVTLAKNDVLHVYGRSRSTSTYVYAANLTIIQTA